MTCGSPNTSESCPCQWLVKQQALQESLQHQPLLLVVRPGSGDLEAPFTPSPLFAQIQRLYAVGLRHLEVAWCQHPGWKGFVGCLQDHCPELQLGAASVTSSEALPQLVELGLDYAMSPCWQPELVAEARSLDVLLVPGVFSPTEVLQAKSFGCGMVKLFPAAELGADYWSRLRSPLGELPFVIAAGGLSLQDIPLWLKAGHGAVALGRRVIGSDANCDELRRWLELASTNR